MSKATPEQLRTVITEMDALAQGGFSQITSMAALALLALEQPRTHASGDSMNSVVQMLSAIQSKAEEIDDHLNAMAEDVGCNYIDSAQRKRLDTVRKARQFAIEGRA